MSEEVKEGVDGTLEQGEFKVPKKKGRPKKLTGEKNEPTKIDLNKNKEDAVQEQSTEKVVLQSNEQEEEKREEGKVELQEVGSTHEEKKPTEQVEKVSPLQEVSNEEAKEDIKEEIIEKTTEEQKQLPENIEKLVNFMEETGGTVEDYVRINADYSNIDESLLLNEYYKKTKPHLDQDEVNFIMEDNFAYDEEVDEERDIRKKKLAYKEEVAKAKNFLEDLKSKYYEEIKLRPGATQEQQKAMDFFNKFKKEQEVADNNRNAFLNKTNSFFNDFKGFDFKVGEKSFKYNINTEGKDFMQNQSDIDNIFKRFLDKQGQINDFNGYHKAIYAAHNVDSIANHFYEQGKADAVKDVVAKSKNINQEASAKPSGDVFINGLKVKAVSGTNASKLKIKYKK